MIRPSSARKVLSIAAVQVHAQLGRVQANLDHYSPLVEQAAHSGAQVIVLPELAASGYSLSHLLWNSAETRSGQTIHWLTTTARRDAVYLGIGFIEADGEDFYNTYAIASPTGAIAGFIRKTMAEVNVFRCASGPHVIETALGTFGVGICADVHFVPFVRSMQSQSVDLLLMPHAWPGAYRVGGAVSQRDIERTYAKARDLASVYAHLLGVPTVMANHVGPRGTEHWGGLLGALMDPAHVKYLGMSTIAAGDGTNLQQMDDAAEGVIVAEAPLDPSQKTSVCPRAHGHYGGGWIDAGQPNDVIRDLLCSMDAFFGRMTYDLSGDRRRKANLISHEAASTGYELQPR